MGAHEQRGRTERWTSGRARPTRDPRRTTRPDEAGAALASLSAPLRLPESSDDMSWPSQCERLARLNQ